MDSIEVFTAKLEGEFDELAPGTLKPDTEYRKLETWSSMHALVVIAFIDSEYDILLKPEEMRSTQTIRDLYNLVNRS
jgi:acyl carrier protein